MPDSIEFASSLHRDCGVTAIVSFQTQIDLLTLGSSWKQMLTLLERGGITTAERVPITDFDETSLSLLLPQAIEAVHRHRSEGHVTYVHCTAGINRAPTVAIGYLVAHHEHSLDDAWDHVRARRRVIPLRGALDRWIERGGPKKRKQEETVA